MITDEELAELPADPEQAFAALERILRQRVQEHEERSTQDENPDTYRLEYMTKVAAAARQYQIDALKDLNIPCQSEGYRGEVYLAYRQFLTDVDFVTMQIRISAAQQNREGSVGLDGPTKLKIHHFIQRIREEIESCDLPQDKKDDLLTKLNKFAAEVDRSRTNLQSATAFFITLCGGIGDGFEKLKPARDMFDSISRMLGQAKGFEEQFTPKLPGPKERKRLEPPPQAEPKGPNVADDDIPF